MKTEQGESFEILAKTIHCIERAEQDARSARYGSAVAELNQVITIIQFMVEGDPTATAFKRTVNGIHQLEGVGDENKMRLAIFLNAFMHVVAARDLLKLEYAEDAIGHIDIFWNEARRVLI
jgi:hypothetical protein